MKVIKIVLFIFMILLVSALIYDFINVHYDFNRTRELHNQYIFPEIHPDSLYAYYFYLEKESRFGDLDSLTQLPVVFLNGVGRLKYHWIFLSQYALYNFNQIQSLPKSESQK